jgi:hypothetical protein
LALARFGAGEPNNSTTISSPSSSNGFELRPFALFGGRGGLSNGFIIKYVHKKKKKIPSKVDDSDLKWAQAALP